MNDPWNDEHNLTPHDYLAVQLRNAADLLRDVAAKSGEVTDDAELGRLLDQINDDVMPSVIGAQGALTDLLFTPKTVDPNAPLESASPEVVARLVKRINDLSDEKRKACKAAFTHTFGLPPQLTVVDLAEANALIGGYEAQVTSPLGLAARAASHARSGA